MVNILFEYPVTREYNIPLWGKVAWVVVILVIFLAINFINVVVTVYDTVTITSTNYNYTETLWYRWFPIKYWMPPGWSCNPSVIQIGEGST